VLPGQIGDNVTTRGIDLLNLPAGTRVCQRYLQKQCSDFLVGQLLQLDLP
jgi:hypothetical protein